MSEIRGVDFSTARPDAGALERAGYAFVIGYVKPLRPDGTPSPMELRAGDVAAYRAAGLGVLTVWETLADRALSGSGGGTADGVAARARAAVIGYPLGAPIFCAVDWQATAAQLPTVLSYVEGFAGGLAGEHPVGVYGSFDVVEYCHTMSLGGSGYYWQTAAWSGGRLSQVAHVYQRATPAAANPPAGTDEDVLCRPVPWAAGVMPSPPPQPAPAPGPAPAPAPVPAPGFDVIGWRAHYGATGPEFVRLQSWANRMFPAYCRISPAPIYGPATAAFLAEYCRRHGVSSDGRDIGPRTAALLYGDGFRG